MSVRPCQLSQLWTAQPLPVLSPWLVRQIRKTSCPSRPHVEMMVTTTMMMIMVMVLMALNAGVVKGKTWVQVTVLHERHLLPLAPDQVLGAGLWVMLRHRQGKALGRWAQ
jgi:hypothetical protein